MFIVSCTLIWAVFTGPTDWVCHIGTLTLCIEAVAWSYIVTWWSGSGWIQAWSQRLTGLVVPEMTYSVFSGRDVKQPTNPVQEALSYNGSSSCQPEMTMTVTKSPCKQKSSQQEVHWESVCCRPWCVEHLAIISAAGHELYKHFKHPLNGHVFRL